MSDYIYILTNKKKIKRKFLKILYLKRVKSCYKYSNYEFLMDYFIAKLTE